MNRSQVVVNGVSSNLDFGVPQGSVLGPMLFVFYTQPISLIVCQCGCDLRKFSDDAQLFSSAPSADLGIRIKQTEQCVDIRHRVCRLPYLPCFSYTHARTPTGLAPRTRRDPFRYRTLSSASTVDCLCDCRLLITACVLYFLVVAYLLK